MYLNALSLLLFLCAEIYLLVLHSNMLPFFIVFFFLGITLLLSRKLLHIFIDLEISELEYYTQKSILNCLLSWHSFLFLKSIIVLFIGFRFLENSLNHILTFSDEYSWSFKLSDNYNSYVEFFKVKPYFISLITFFNFYIDKISFVQNHAGSTINASSFFISNSVSKLLV